MEVGIESAEHSTCSAAFDAFSTPLYVLYTSGSSTGIGKGVIGSHGATCTRLHWMWDAFPFSRNQSKRGQSDTNAAWDIVVRKTPLVFVDSVWEIFGTLLSGKATLLIPQPPSPRQHLSMSYLVSHPVEFLLFCSAQQVTRLTVVPSLLWILLKLCRQRGEKMNVLCNSLNFCIVSGEPLTASLIQEFQRNFTSDSGTINCTLLNLYGSTETCGDAFFHVALCKGSLLSRESMSNSVHHGSCIGVPLSPKIAFAYVCKSNTKLGSGDGMLHHPLEELPPGETGELFIGGSILNIGYSTGKSAHEVGAGYFCDGFSGTNVNKSRSHSRLFATGDLVTMDKVSSFLDLLSATFFHAVASCPDCVFHIDVVGRYVLVPSPRFCN